MATRSRAHLSTVAHGAGVPHAQASTRRRRAIIDHLLPFFLAVVLLGPQAGGALRAESGFPHYTIALNVDWSGKSFAGSEEIQWVNTSGARLEEVFLRLFPNAPSLYGNGLLEVGEVHVGDETAATRLLEGNTVLRVQLPGALEAGAALSLSVAFSGRPAAWDALQPGTGQVGYGTFAATEHTMALASFYPILAVESGDAGSIAPVGTIGDPVTSEAGSYTVALTTPCGLTALTSGELASQEKAGDRCVTTFAGEGVRDFMVVLGNEYRQETQSSSGVLLRASFFPKHRWAQSVALACARAALSVYTELFGPYPYGELDLVEVPLERAAGVEYPGLVLVGEDYCDRPEDYFFSVIVAHEVAHQWWYAVVGNDVVQEPWLDEGLATFSSGLFLERESGETAARTAIAEWQRAYEEVRAQYPGLCVASPTTLFPDGKSYSGFVYSGGALLFDALRGALGDARFFGVLQGYYRDEAFLIARGSSLVARFLAEAPADVPRIFSEYLYPREKTSPALSSAP